MGKNTMEDLLAEFIGLVMIIGIAIGLGIAGVIWGIVEIVQWLF